MNEIKVINTTELQNKKLTTQCNRMYAALRSMEKNKWSFAEAVANIMENKLYADDFETDKDFANFIGVSKSYISRVCKCVKYHNVEIVNAWSISKIQELIGIALSDIEMFITKYNLNEESTVKQIREAVKMYCDGCGESTITDEDIEEDCDNVIDSNCDNVVVSDCDTETEFDVIRKKIYEVIKNSDNDTIFRIYDILKMNGVMNGVI